MAKKLKLSHDDLEMVKGTWDYKTSAFSEVEVVNLVQFLTPAERIHFVNELHRVMKKGGKCQLIAPHWCSSRAYGDMMFQWPPVSESWLHHLNKDWREKNAPWGKGYTCDFDVGCGYGLHPELLNRNPEYQQNAVTFWKEACQDLAAMLTKR